METTAFLTRLKQAFTGAATAEPLPEPDEKLALGALMVRVALSDKVYHLTEISEIDHLLGQFYGLKPVEAAKMRATCEKLAKQAPGSDDFAHMIRETVSEDSRIAALEAMWKVAMADGKRTPEELEVMEHARVDLGLSAEQCASARVAAKGH
ncbi:TerB family tellurite resistance protein [Roseovarius sp. EL26]|uniref:tellurite resistance TerB family protein n=1 Tax=Roseovarius sp. EL26 TaxID=2126672 RepID=UPI000EA26839|nr:TerB family tellurite resistance protein [Roseovarius sp. EL26]